MGASSPKKLVVMCSHGRLQIFLKGHCGAALKVRNRGSEGLGLGRRFSSLVGVGYGEEPVPYSQKIFEFFCVKNNVFVTISDINTVM